MSAPRRIGIVGAGQLGRMMALAAYPLGLSCLFYDRSADTPGGQVGPIVTGAFDDPAQLEAFARQCDVVTFDWENVPVASLRLVAKHVPVAPGPRVLEVAQDRLLEKTLFRDLGIPTPDFAPVDLRSDLDAAVARLGLPAVLKTRRDGYDGKGQFVLRKPADLDRAWAQLGGAALILESFVPFSHEVSQVVTRDRQGNLAWYPLARNEHIGGILAVSRAPHVDAALTRLARRHTGALLAHFAYVGTFTVEYFVKDGRLLANEMAPRVHNSGHWTIEGAATSQFANHVRAIAGLPLGSAAATGHAAMVNFIGRMPTARAALKVPGLAFHDYGKSPRPGRKLGHGTLVAATAAAREGSLRAARALAGVPRAPAVRRTRTRSGG
jgi:5-(carboxyamino)imidazole ribonucleotide synthase